MSSKGPGAVAGALGLVSRDFADGRAAEELRQKRSCCCEFALRAGVPCVEDHDVEAHESEELRLSVMRAVLRGLSASRTSPRRVSAFIHSLYSKEFSVRVFASPEGEESRCFTTQPVGEPHASSRTLVSGFRSVGPFAGAENGCFAARQRWQLRSPCITAVQKSASAAGPNQKLCPGYACQARAEAGAYVNSASPSF
jgi:hypothetical protein